MGSRQNYYRTLHVQPDAPSEIIQSSYRTLMTKLRRHPDLGGDHLTATQINEAYAVLMDPAKRAAYDRSSQDEADAPAAAGYTASGKLASCLFCGAAHGFGGRIHTTATCTTCSAPLAPVVRQQLEAGQRGVSRIPRRLPLVYFTGWPGQGPYPAETRDLSLYGLRFVANAAVPVTKILKVDCEGLSAVVRAVACDDCDERDWRWLIRAEFLTVRFRRSRGGFLATRA